MERKLLCQFVKEPKINVCIGTSKGVSKPQWGWKAEFRVPAAVIFMFSSSFVPQHEEDVLGLQLQVTSEVTSEVSAELWHRKIHRKTPFLSLQGCKVLWRGTEHPVGGELLATVLRWGQAAGADGLEPVCPSLCQHLGAVGHLQLQQGGAQSFIYCRDSLLFYQAPPPKGTAQHN